MSGRQWRRYSTRRSEGRRATEDHTVWGRYNRTSSRTTDIVDGVLHPTLWNQSLARAAVENKFVVAMRDVFGNFQTQETTQSLEGHLPCLFGGRGVGEVGCD